MDFFGEQARARRKSRWLIFWFALAVLCIVLAVYFIAAITFNPARLLSGKAEAPSPSFWDARLFFWTCLLVGGGIVLASLYKILQISKQGGAFIATELGGRYIPRETADADERRLLNVVDEMSIAAGIPAPQVFLLDDEADLNAFAAGATPADSVVAVTRGLLDRLNRDQLQGVIGHEISHLVNGDARLNMRLIGVLNGILILTKVGRALCRARGRKSGGIVLFGIFLTLIGYIGVFFGRLIKASVSRQREYLADASAVQFTRNPEGISGALRQIAYIGSRIEHPNAEEASHLFFSNSGGFSFLQLFASHPPIEQRIARIDNIDPSSLPKSNPQRTNGADEETGISFLNAIGGTEIRYAQKFLAELPPPLAADLNRPHATVAVVFALLLSKRPEIQQAQLDAITQSHTRQTADAACAHQQWLQGEAPHKRLPLLDMTLPALRELDTDARQRCLATVDVLINADGRVSASEFALHHILKNTLLPTPVRMPLRLEKLDTDITRLLALIAYAGNSDATAAAAAYQHALPLSPVSNPQPFPTRNALKPELVENALARLSQANPRFRQKLLQACVAAVEHDGKITVTESELLRAFAQSLDCPVPPLLA
ncbi:Zn-dependent protease [Betaproteobacteria bacterium]|nr:Zn-dependent protease [Betaproteobacteria bacterium]GHU41985.1 Zn-dependent protease [Betaproteobacteria bacterium]